MACNIIKNGEDVLPLHNFHPSFRFRSNPPCYSTLEVSCRFAFLAHQVPKRELLFSVVAIRSFLLPGPAILPWSCAADFQQFRISRLQSCTKVESPSSVKRVSPGRSQPQVCISKTNSFSTWLCTAVHPDQTRVHCSFACATSLGSLARPNRSFGMHVVHT